jgi:phage repressor protein C with HTH and peptisase S24 domain
VNDLAANLKAFMSGAGLSENELARRTGVPQPTIHRVLSGKSEDPRSATLRPIAELAGVRVDDLREMTVERALALGKVVQSKLVVREPVAAYDVRAIERDDEIDTSREALVEEVNVIVSGGDGAQVPEFVETKYRMPFQLYWFQRFQAKPENVKLMRVRGNSMEPLLYDGDRIAVHLADRDVVSDHVYALILDGECKVKRLFRTAGGVRVVSDNSDKDRYRDEIVPSDAADRIYIIGRVIDRSGSGGL